MAIYMASYSKKFDNQARPALPYVSSSKHKTTTFCRFISVNFVIARF